MPRLLCFALLLVFLLLGVSVSQFVTAEYAYVVFLPSIRQNTLFTPTPSKPMPTLVPTAAPTPTIIPLPSVSPSPPKIEPTTAPP